MNEKKSIGKYVGKVVAKVPGKAGRWNDKITMARVLDPKLGDDNLMLSIFRQNEEMSNKDAVTLVKGFKDVPDDEILIKMSKDAEELKDIGPKSIQKTKASLTSKKAFLKAPNKADNDSDNIVWLELKDNL